MARQRRTTACSTARVGRALWLVSRARTFIEARHERRHADVLTDVNAERYWTVVAEINVPNLEEYTKTSRESMEA